MSLLALVSGAQGGTGIENDWLGGGLLNLVWLGLFMAFCLFCGWQVYRHEVRPYRGVRSCTCHPERSRRGKVIGSEIPINRRPWRG